MGSDLRQSAGPDVLILYEPPPFQAVVMIFALAGAGENLQQQRAMSGTSDLIYLQILSDQSSVDDVSSSGVRLSLLIRVHNIVATPSMLSLQG